MISTTANRDEGPSMVAWGDCFYFPAPNPARLDKTSGHSVNMGLGLKDTHLMKKQIKALRERHGLVSHGQSLRSSPSPKAGSAPIQGFSE